MINLAIRDRIGRRLLEEAQEFLPELQFFDHVDYIKGNTSCNLCNPYLGM